MGVGGKEKKQAKDQCRLRKCLLDVALGTHLWGREEGIGICLGRCVGNLNWGWRRCLWSPRGLPGCAVGRVLSVVGLVPDGHCLPLPVTFHRLSGTFLTLFLERALRLIPSPHRPSTPKAPSAKNAIWKPGSQKSRAVNQTSEPAGPVWEEREKGRVLGHEVGSGCGQGPRVLIPGQGSLCLSLPSVECGSTCPCLVVRELQGQLRCLTPEQEESQGGNSSVSNSRRWCCIYGSLGSLGIEKMYPVYNLPSACLCWVQSQRAKPEFLLCLYWLHNLFFLNYFLNVLQFLFDVDHLKSLYWISYNIVSVFCVGVLAMRHVGS